MIATDDKKLMKQFDARLSAVEKNVNTIADAIVRSSLEEKLGRAIEIIENKIDELRSSIIKESPYSTIMDWEVSGKHYTEVVTYNT